MEKDIKKYTDEQLRTMFGNLQSEVAEIYKNHFHLMMNIQNIQNELERRMKEKDPSKKKVSEK